MRTRTIPRSTLALLTALGTAAFAPTTRAQSDYDWKVFIGPSYVMPLNDSDIGGDKVEASAEIGYEFGVEWKPTDRFGIEVAYLDADQDIEVNGATFGEIGFNPWNVTLNFHLINTDAFNWYIGPTVSMIDWGDLEVPGAGSESIESETAIGVSTGFAIGFGDTLALQFGFRYIDAGAESSDGDEVDVDPLLAHIALAFRF
jgi:outer membrane protein W